MRKRILPAFSGSKAVASGRAPLVAVAPPPSSTSEAAIAVEATVSDDGGGIGQIEWRINGAVLGLSKPTGTERVQNLRKSLALAPGENRIEVVAYNAQGYVASVGAQVTVNSTRPASTKPPRLYVLAAGVNDYQAQSFTHLKFARADAGAIGDALQQAGGRLYESIEVMRLFDQDVTAAKLDETARRSGRYRADAIRWILSPAGAARHRANAAASSTETSG